VLRPSRRRRRRLSATGLRRRGRNVPSPSMVIDSAPAGIGANSDFVRIPRELPQRAANCSQRSRPRATPRRRKPSESAFVSAVGRTGRPRHRRPPHVRKRSGRRSRTHLARRRRRAARTSGVPLRRARRTASASQSSPTNRSVGCPGGRAATQSATLATATVTSATPPGVGCSARSSRSRSTCLIPAPLPRPGR